MLNILYLVVFSSFSLGFFADPIAQGASVKLGTEKGIVFSLVTSGRVGERQYEYWLYDTISGSYDTTGSFHWFKFEVRAERPYFERKGVKLYLQAGLGATSDREWIFNEQTLLWREYSYKSIGGIVGTGLYIYPFPFFMGLLDIGEKSTRKTSKIEDGFMIQIELLNLYYRKFFGERPKPRTYTVFNYGGVGMGIGFYYTF